MGGRFPRVPGYVLGDRIGAGGSGTVWRGTDRTTGEAVALKHLPVGSPAALAEARAEAAVLLHLEHPHLVRLRETVALSDAVVLVLDYAARGSLAALLGKRRLTPGETITALCGVASAVAYAHGAGVVHGDVSPANIVFTERGDAVLTDLGLARLLGAAAPSGGGTPGYVAPELTDGLLPSPATDVFSLGAVAFHCLTGSALAADGRAAEMLAQAQVPAAMAEVVLRALDPEPARRGTAADFALDLRHSGHPVAVEFDAGRSAVPRSPAPTRAVAVPPRPDPAAYRRRARRRRLTLLGGSAAALAAVAAAAVLFVPGGSAEPPPFSSVPPSVAAPALPSTAPDDVATVLARLDAVRQRAYAERKPGLLSSVYAPGPLLQRDRTQLTSLVPVGCGLDGVRTNYRDQSVLSRTSATVVLTARIALPATTLHCATGGQRTAAAQPATAVRITLQHTADGYRIAAIDPV